MAHRRPVGQPLQPVAGRSYPMDGRRRRPRGPTRGPTNSEPSHRSPDRCRPRPPWDLTTHRAVVPASRVNSNGCPWTPDLPTPPCAAV